MKRFQICFIIVIIVTMTETADFLESVELSFQMVKVWYYLIKISSPFINFKNYLKFKPTFRNYSLREINMERLICKHSVW